MSDHEAVTVNSAKGELAHLPWFIFDYGNKIGRLGFEAVVITIRIGDSQISEIAMASEITGWLIVGAFPKHDHAVVFLHKDPTGMLGNDFEIEHLNIILRGSPDIVHREHVVVLENGGWHRGEQCD